MKIEGKIVDLHQRRIYEGAVSVENGRIRSIEECANTNPYYIMAGFVDSHVHIESSMLTPCEFGKMVVRSGTVAVVCDPHEIANVMGMEGVEFMLSDSNNAPIKNFFGIPSCVPATPFDNAGAVINAEDVERLASSGRFVTLSEMMNVPGVLFEDEQVMRKLATAKKYGLKIDGHAPLLRGEGLKKYIEKGITTDHETSSLSEAQEKIENGMKIQIRQGSSTCNYESLRGLIATSPDSLMFCTDDSHPAEILHRGHISYVVQKAIEDEFNLFDVLRIASVNAVEHYSLEVGLLREGDPADFIVVKDLHSFEVLECYINGDLRYKKSVELQTKESETTSINNFWHRPIGVEQLCKSYKKGEIDVIGVIPDEIITTHKKHVLDTDSANFESDLCADILKIAYINRYSDSAPVVAHINGFGLKRGAFASSVGHDSHNIVAVGCDDKSIAEAVNMLIENRGGIAVVDDDKRLALPLEIGGIMSLLDAEEVAQRYTQLQAKIKDLGCTLNSPLMTLSFMSLVVIPALKIGEQGLFDFQKFDWL